MKTRSLDSPARVRSGRVAMTVAAKRWLMIALLVALLLGLAFGGAPNVAAAADVTDQLPAVVSGGQQAGDPTQADRAAAMLCEVEAALQVERTPSETAGRRGADQALALVRLGGALPWTPTLISGR